MKKWSYGGNKPGLSYGGQKHTILRSSATVTSSFAESRTGGIMTVDGLNSEFSRLQGDFLTMCGSHPGDVRNQISLSFSCPDSRQVERRPSIL